MSFARILIWIVVAGVIAADVLCVAFRWQTISAAVRQLDVESGSLVRWLLLGLWLHWFALNWPFK